MKKTIYTVTSFFMLFVFTSSGMCGEKEVLGALQKAKTSLQDSFLNNEFTELLADVGRELKLIKAERRKYIIGNDCFIRHAERVLLYFGRIRYYQETYGQRNQDITNEYWEYALRHLERAYECSGD